MLPRPRAFLADLPDDAIDGKVKKAPEITESVTSWKPVAKERPPTATGTLFRPGDRVMHAKFGDGTVLGSVKQRDDEEVDVFFAANGRKRLSASMSGLKKMK